MTSIEWTDETWNAMVGCSPARGSEQAGCRECYASGEVHRFSRQYNRRGVVRLNVTNRNALTFLPRDPVTGKSLGKGAKWTGEVWLLPHVLALPLRKRKPAMWFVNSISDLFHESVVGCEEGRRFIAAMFGVMAVCPQHRFQCLTKRPERAREWFTWLEEQADGHCVNEVEYCVLMANEVMREAECGPDLWAAADDLMDRWMWASMGEYGFEAVDGDDARACVRRIATAKRNHADNIDDEEWPRKNIWLGTSVEDQPAADFRIDGLRESAASVRFLSVEPLLGPVDLDLDGIDWVIVGGESGPKARACEVPWIRSVVEQCRAAGVPCFVKQLGSRPLARDEYDLGDDHFCAYDCHHPPPEPFPSGGWYPKLRDAKGGDPREWPAELRVREMPKDLR